MPTGLPHERRSDDFLCPARRSSGPRQKASWQQTSSLLTRAFQTALRPVRHRARHPAAHLFGISEHPGNGFATQATRELAETGRSSNESSRPSPVARRRHLSSSSGARIPPRACRAAAKDVVEGTQICVLTPKSPQRRADGGEEASEVPEDPPSSTNVGSSADRSDTASHNASSAAVDASHLVP